MEIDAIRALVAPVVDSLGAERAVLFGSVARGTDDERSDIDLLVIDDRDEAYLDRIARYFPPLSEVLPRPVELLVYTERELQDAGGRPFIEQLLREGVVIYERGEAGRRGAPLVVAGTS